ncbi:diguanylate cyclase [Microbacterium natoriense]
MVVQDIQASDAEDLRWLRFGWLRSIRERTSTFSVVTATLLLYFGVLGVFELFEDDLPLFEQILSGGTILLCLGAFAMVAFFGLELPMWSGLALIAAHALVSVYYLGFSDERQNAIAAFQELPIMAMYFSWFYGARIARTGVLAIVVVVGAATAIGQFSGPGGLLGPVNIVAAALFTWMCLEAGIFMRHRNRLESHSDELTGTLNRRGFEAKTTLEIRRALRHNRPLSVAVLDLDKFKHVNDEAGHAAGDYVLRAVSAHWMSLSRSTDIVGRLGGDEFAMLMPETDVDEARSLMLRLREYTPHPWSWGVAQVRPDDTAASVLARADAAMYDDKRR